MKTFRNESKPNKLQAASENWQNLNKRDKRQKRNNSRGKQWQQAEA